MEQSTETDVEEILQELASKPDARMEVKFPPITAGARVRRQVRLLIAAAEIDGLDVDHREEKGFLDSVFLIRMTGRSWLLAYHLGAMAMLVDASSRRR